MWRWLPLLLPGLALAAGPAFDCRKVETGSIAERVCQDPALAALDRRLDEVYRAARARAANERPPVLQAGQRGWVRERDDCWKAQGAERACIEDRYRRRIAFLQVRYRLLEPRLTQRLACDGEARNEVLLRFFATEPPTVDAERGDRTAFFYPEPTGSGTLYVARNERLREHSGEFSLQWGFDAPWMRCLPQR